MMQAFSPDRPLIGVGMKMYKSYAETATWLEGFVERIAHHKAVSSGQVQLFVLPGFVSLETAVRTLKDTAVQVGAQDVYFEQAGAFTGEVSPRDLVEVGCRYVEVGHKERRTLFGETDELIAKKTAAALRVGLVPIICVGEPSQSTPEEAGAICVAQLESYLSVARAEGLTGQVVVAYEPYWAIGSDKPASNDYISGVNEILQDSVADLPGSTILYGGSAGAGMLEGIYPGAKGLFLGRSGQDLSIVESIIDEAAALSG